MEELESVLQVTDGIEVLRLQKIILEIEPQMFVQSVSTPKLVRIIKVSNETITTEAKTMQQQSRFRSALNIFRTENVPN